MASNKNSRICINLPKDLIDMLNGNSYSEKIRNIGTCKEYKPKSICNNETQMEKKYCLGKKDCEKIIAEYKVLYEIYIRKYQLKDKKKVTARIANDTYNEINILSKKYNLSKTKVIITLLIVSCYNNKDIEKLILQMGKTKEEK